MSFYIISRLNEWFTQTSDDTDLRRKKCILGGAMLYTFFAQSLNVLQNIATGQTVFANWSGPVSLFVVMTILAYFRLSRKLLVSRVAYFLLALFYNFYNLVTLGGFVCNPSVFFTGLMTPLLSLFLCRRTSERILWLAFFLAGNVTVAVAEVHGYLPAFETSRENLILGNLISMIFNGSVYLLSFWFVVVVYNTEMSVRLVMEKEIDVYSRASEQIREPCLLIAERAETMAHWTSVSSDQKHVISDLNAASHRIRQALRELLASSSSSTTRAGAQVGDVEAGFSLLRRDAQNDLDGTARKGKGLRVQGEGEVGNGSSYQQMGNSPSSMDSPRSIRPSVSASHVTDPQNHEGSDDRGQPTPDPPAIAQGQVSQDFSSVTEGPSLSYTSCGVASSLSAPTFARQSPSTEPAQSTLPKRILCIDDNFTNLQLICMFVKQASGWEYEVDSALDGLSALKLLAKYDYSLIFMDYLLPGINGADLTVRLRKQFCMTPIVGVSAVRAADVQQACLDAGMNAFLVKPFSPDEIRDSIRRFAK